ncbi:MAG: TIGR02147 family protein [Bdellovibrionota bacterium]
MLNAFTLKSYQDLIKSEYENRKQKNKNYSLRAYSRDLHVSTSKLSEILAGNETLSLGLAGRIANHLPYTEPEKEYFINLVRAKNGKTIAERNLAKAYIQKVRNAGTFKNHISVTHDIFEKWYLLLLVELLTMPKPHPLPHIAKIIGIPEEEVHSSTDLLLTSGYLTKNERNEYKRGSKFLKFESKSPSSQIRNYHKNYLKKAQEEIDRQPIESRKYLTNLIALDIESLPSARKELELFSEEFIKKYASARANVVYAFALQLYRLDNQEPSE